MKTVIGNELVDELVKELEEAHTLDLPMARGTISPTMHKAIWLKDAIDIIKGHQKERKPY